MLQNEYSKYLIENIGFATSENGLSKACATCGSLGQVRCLTGALKKANVNVSLFVRKGGDMLSKWVGEVRVTRIALHALSSSKTAVQFILI